MLRYKYFMVTGEDSGKFGNQRLWGSVGWGLFGVIAGWLVDVYSEGKALKDYSPIFYLMAVILVLNILVTSRLQVTFTSQPRYTIIKLHLFQAAPNIKSTFTEYKICSMNV